MLTLAEARNKDGKAKTPLSDAAKKTVTESTGRVWEDCDLIARLAEEGISGFAVRKARQWLELMKDAVKEFEDWDPNEEVDENDLFGDVGSDDGDDEEDGSKGSDGDRATISAGVKDQALRVLRRIPQSVHVVVKQRLEKIPAFDPMLENTRAWKERLNLVLKRTREVSECIDESAEAMYMGDLEMCLKKAGEARALTIEVVDAVITPWESKEGGEESREDKYVKKALEWIQQVDPGDKKA